MNSIKLPLFSIISVKRNVGGCCDHCGRNLKHVVTLKDNSNNKVLDLGTGCVKTFTGKNLKEIYAEEKIHQSQLRELDIETKARARVFNFKEVNPEMMNYIENNQNNQFIRNMKKVIEERGTLSSNMYATVYSMMLPVANLDEKVKDLDATLIRIKKDTNNFGYQSADTYTLFCETNGELIRVFFSSMTDKLNTLLKDKGVYTSDGEQIPELFDKQIHLNVSGSFDGYKIKRAKLTK